MMNKACIGLSEKDKKDADEVRMKYPNLPKITFMVYGDIEKDKKELARVLSELQSSQNTEKNE